MHWTWHVMHDPQGLIKLLGGKEKFIEELDYALTKGEPYNFGQWNPYYNQSNQPVMHAVYLFDNAGAPWKTQKWVRAIMEKSYGTGPDGMVGNDDVGSMSSWYVFSAMGFYPVAPGELVYSLGNHTKESTILNKHKTNENQFEIWHFRCFGDNADDHHVYKRCGC